MIDVGLAAKVAMVAEGSPAVKATAAVRVSARPPTLAETVAEPAALGDVSSAV